MARISMTAEHYEAIQTVLKKVISKKGTDWDVIMEKINSEGLKIKNWLQVRAVLQGLISQKLVSRTSDLNEEIYVKN